jgi:LacI family transcriptional regulator
MSSLKRLADELALSITTVSRALDDKPDVSAATKARVREAALRLNYQPNAAARSLRKRKADAAAVVLPAAASHVGVAAVLNMLFESGRRLAEHGIDLMILPAPTPDSEIEVLRRVVDGRRADALIIVRTRLNDPRVTFLTQRNIPFITHGRTESAVSHPFIDGDGTAGFRAATRGLAALGHRRILHLAAPLELAFAHYRRLGWLQGMRDAELSTDGLEVACAPNEAAAQAAVRKLLERSNRPSAILCATDAMAVGAISALRQAGMTAGIDISVIGHDGLPAGLFTDPPLSTMEIDASDVGSRLADMLIRRIAGAPVEELQLVLPIRQVPRATHGPARRAAAE